MTRPRFDSHSTEFGLWLREQDEIDSSLGYVATNVDYVWCNYKTGDWMLIEEKRHMAKVKWWQRQIFNLLAWCCKHHFKFHGFHILQFENTSPTDGKIFLDNKKITEKDLIKFLQFST